MADAWSDDIVNRLKGFAAQGYSASRAAEQFPGMTRNAAVGLARRRKFHFLGGKGGSVARPKPPAPKCEDAEPPREGMITFAELQPDSCRYPHGETDFRFCGQKRLEGKPYCAHHCRISYGRPNQ